MCFRDDIRDDQDQPIGVRKTSFFNSNLADPTQQPIHITQSNEAHMSELQPEPNRRLSALRKHSYKDRAAFVDVTDQDRTGVKAWTKKPAPVDQEALAPKQTAPRKKPKVVSMMSDGAMMGAMMGAGTVGGM